MREKEKNDSDDSDLGEDDEVLDNHQEQLIVPAVNMAIQGNLKLDIGNFSNAKEQSIDDWIVKYESLTEIFGWDAAKRKLAFSTFLVESAKEWYVATQPILEAENEKNWDQWKAELKSAFSRSLDEKVVEL